MSHWYATGSALITNYQTYYALGVVLGEGIIIGDGVVLGDGVVSEMALSSEMALFWVTTFLPAARRGAGRQLALL